MRRKENKGQHHLGSFLEKAWFELGPEIPVDICELLEAEAGRAFQLGEQHEHGWAPGRVGGGAIRSHAHLEPSVFQWKKKGLQGYTHLVQVLAQSLACLINFSEAQFLHLSIGRKSILLSQRC